MRTGPRQFTLASMMAMIAAIAVALAFPEAATGLVLFLLGPMLPIGGFFIFFAMIASRPDSSRTHPEMEQ